MVRIGRTRSADDILDDFLNKSLYFVDVNDNRFAYFEDLVGFGAQQIKNLGLDENSIIWKSKIKILMKFQR